MVELLACNGRGGWPVMVGRQWPTDSGGESGEQRERDEKYEKEKMEGKKSKKNK